MKIVSEREWIFFNKFIQKRISCLVFCSFYIFYANILYYILFKTLTILYNIKILREGVVAERHTDREIVLSLVLYCRRTHERLRYTYTETGAEKKWRKLTISAGTRRTEGVRV